MAFTFNVTNVVDWQKNFPDTPRGQDAEGCDQFEWHPAIQAIGTLAMLCGFQQITAKNLDEVFTRVFMLESVQPIRPGNRFTFAEISKLVGYRCNVSDKSNLQFDKLVASIVRDAAVRELHAQKKGGA